MNNLLAIRLFIQIAEVGSFVRVAEYNQMSKGAVSRQIQQLEKELSTRLFQRTTRSIHLTEDGKDYLQRCQTLLAEYDDMQAMFQQAPEQIRGKVRVDMPQTFATQIIIPHLAEFQQRYPHIEVTLNTVDGRSDLIRDGLDFVVRAGALSDSSLVMKSLGQVRKVNCASPVYLQQFGEPTRLDQLVNHRLLQFSYRPNGFEVLHKTQLSYVEMPISMTLNNSNVYVTSGEAGLGIIQVSLLHAQPSLEQGKLVEILTNYRSAPLAFYLLYPHRKNLPQRVQVFMDWVEVVAKRELAIYA